MIKLNTNHRPSAIAGISSGSGELDRTRVDLVFAEAVRRRIVFREYSMNDLRWEWDLSGMAFPVARAACRYILNTIRTKNSERLQSLTFNTGLGVGKNQQRANGDAKINDNNITSLREYVREVLLADFNPSLKSADPAGTGTVQVDEEYLRAWINCNN
jgi:hypothetical protein